MFKLLNSMFLLIFLLCAAVQYNDPDAARWIAIYLAAALMCINQWWGPRQQWLPPTLALASLAWALLLLPAVVGQVSPAEVFESLSMRTREVEEAREIGGLLILCSWAAYLSLRGGANKSG